MSYSDSYTSSPFDQQLADTPGLTWVPWVGKNYANLPTGRKVLIVAESHYTNEQDPEKIPSWMAGAMADKTFTRAVVTEGLIECHWPNRTFSTMHQLFYSPVDREAFWHEVAFYNIVQRPMWYRDGGPERPTWEDFWKGWEPFLKVVEILKPDHVLFIGVEASNHFNGFMSRYGHDHVAIKWAEKVGSAYARTASLTVDGRHVPLHFIKHCGSYFATDRWSDYLHRNAHDLMASLASSAGTIAPTIRRRQLHVLGMAKSCLDLRGANAPKLELDFLRLVSAIRDFEEIGEEAVGYLIVLDERVEARANSWRAKYGIGEKIVVQKADLHNIQFEALQEEKARHAIGMLQKYLFHEVEKELSVAELGKQLGESALSQKIETEHRGIAPLHTKLPRTELPLQVAWDYYGTLPIEN